MFLFLNDRLQSFTFASSKKRKITVHVQFENTSNIEEEWTEFYVHTRNTPSQKDAKTYRQIQEVQKGDIDLKWVQYRIHSKQ